jgi:hypothetical protein
MSVAAGGKISKCLMTEVLCIISRSSQFYLVESRVSFRNFVQGVTGWGFPPGDHWLQVEGWPGQGTQRKQAGGES